MTTTKNGWQYKVVKSQRGSDGLWFRYAGVTFDTELEAVEYAEQFAREQSAVPGTKILVVSRKGNHVIKSILTDASRKGT